MEAEARIVKLPRTIAELENIWERQASLAFLSKQKSLLESHVTMLCHNGKTDCAADEVKTFVYPDGSVRSEYVCTGAKVATSMRDNMRKATEGCEMKDRLCRSL